MSDSFQCFLLLLFFFENFDGPLEIFMDHCKKKKKKKKNLKKEKDGPKNKINNRFGFVYDRNLRKSNKINYITDISLTKHIGSIPEFIYLFVLLFICKSLSSVPSQIQ